jgi:group I intron endonuclease
MYVGQTINIHKRFKNYQIEKRKRFIDNAIRKYGWDNFEKFVYIVPENDLDYFEVELIKNLNTLSPSGYNLTTGGNKYKRFSEESKIKLSLSQIELNKNRKNPFYGKHHDLETRKRMSLNAWDKWGEKHPRAIKIICIETGKIYSTLSEPEKILNISRASICSCCKGRLKTAGGFHWMYYDDYLKNNSQEAS